MVTHGQTWGCPTHISQAPALLLTLLPCVLSFPLRCPQSMSSAGKLSHCFFCGKVPLTASWRFSSKRLRDLTQAKVKQCQCWTWYLTQFSVVCPFTSTSKPQRSTGSWRWFCRKRRQHLFWKATQMKQKGEVKESPPDPPRLLLV